MDNIKKAVETLLTKNPIEFKETIGNELSSRVFAAIKARKESVASGIALTQEESVVVSEAGLAAPSAPSSGGKVGKLGSERSNSGAAGVADPLDDDLRAELELAFGLGKESPKESEKIAKDDDLSLDPNFEKEFYMSETDYKGHKVMLKQVGLGLSKPIRVYVDGKRWEFFAGPEIAEKASHSYIDQLILTAKQDHEAEQNEEVSDEVDGDFLEEKVSLDGRLKIYKETRTRLEQSRKLRETKLKQQKELGETRHKGLYDDGSGKGARIPEPIDFAKPSDIASQFSGQTSFKEETSMSVKEILAAVNMKGGKYMMGEEELSPKQKQYRKFFDGALKKFGKKSPADFSDDAGKKKFFDYIKKNWKG